MSSAPRRPNILIFQNDQQGGQTLDPGHPCRTPNADRLAREGLTFRRAYTTTAHCCPSRATFMTGLYPSRHGIYNNVLNDAAIHTSLNAGVVTFSEVLRDAGYALGFSGKWHVCRDEQPQDRGWKQYHATAIEGEWHGLRWERFREMAREPEDTTPRQRGQLLRPGWGRYQLYGTRAPNPESDPFDAGDLKTVRAGIQALEELAAQDQPWCLYVGPVGPHDPTSSPNTMRRCTIPKTCPCRLTGMIISWTNPASTSASSAFGASSAPTSTARPSPIIGAFAPCRMISWAWCWTPWSAPARRRTPW
jgi:arylsulfatase A-like enzyme